MGYRRHVALCVLAAASIASAQQATFTTANAVSFTVSTERDAYNSQEQISLRYEIKNVSERPLYVPRHQGEISCPPNSGPQSVMHVDAWFENAAGKKFHSGWLGACIDRGERRTLSQRMSEAAVLLRPGEHLDGTIALQGNIFRLAPGDYQIDAVLYGWKEDEFSEQELRELSTMGAPFLRGETPASVPIIITH